MVRASSYREGKIVVQIRLACLRLINLRSRPGKISMLQRDKACVLVVELYAAAASYHNHYLIISRDLSFPNGYVARLIQLVYHYSNMKNGIELLKR